MPRKLYAFVLSALFVFSTSTFAEVETTSSIRGIVNVSGAEVTVTHVPTGTTKTRTANEDGLFFVSDLLIGGPYEINASASGYQSQSQSGLYLVLNKTAAIEITLVSNNMEEIGCNCFSNEWNDQNGRRHLSWRRCDCWCTNNQPIHS